MRILIANRGEIAVRIIRTAHTLGYETVAVYADPDHAAPHVRLASVSTRLGPAELASSYLSVDAVLEAAHRTGATAVHPGYGFLSESAAAARAVQAAGLMWIGPRPEAIEAMGSKIEARRLAEEAGVAIIPGYDASQDDAALAGAASRIGYPVLVKAAAGGGGKGIRIALTPAELTIALAEARSEATRSFGDDAVIVERYITRPRHVEVQVVGDHHGNVIDLGTRECSVQRRYQKVLEEAPAPNVDGDTEAELRSAAVALAKAISYDSVGTVEFVLDDDTGDAFFLEMNSRLQVEHPVTEAVTGLDLVELQLRVAAGERAPFPVEGVSVTGHAFEARINAEDPFRGYAPQAGVVSVLDVPQGMRWDSGIEVGTVVTPRYDSMMGKLIVHGPDRDAARRRLAAAVDGLLLGGIRTNGGLHRWLLRQEPVIAGRVTTRFLDDSGGPVAPENGEAQTLAAVGWLAARDEADASGDVWHRIGPRRLTPHVPHRPVYLEDLDGHVTEVRVTGSGSRFRVDNDRALADVSVADGRLAWTEGGLDRSVPARVDLAGRRVVVALDGVSETFMVRSQSVHWASVGEQVAGAVGNIVAPFPAVVAEVRVTPGDLVHSGQVVAVMEAMKMLHSLSATGTAVVSAVLARPGDQVDSGAVLIRFEEGT